MIHNDQNVHSDDDEVELDKQRDVIENNQNVHSEEDEVDLDEQMDVVANESFLLENEDLEKHKVEIIAGDKEGSEWLV